MNYLVLGGSGFIGRSLVLFLEQKGHTVTNLDIALNQKNDLRKIAIENLSEFDGCFFLAWDVGGSKYLNQKELWNSQYRNNIALINNVIPQLEKSKIPFLFVSSQLAGLDESPYSLTKFVAENYCRTIENSVVARQWNAYGVMEKQDIKSHVVSDLVYSALTSKQINLITTGLEQRKFVHIDDICNAYYIMLTEHLGNIYDVSAGDYISILSLAEIIRKYTGAEIKPGLIKGIDPVVKEYSTVPGWEPKISISSGVENLIKIMLGTIKLSK